MTKLIAKVEFSAIDGIAEGAYVLRDMGEDRYQRYVTHWFNAEFNGYNSGHYFTDVVEALENFTDRVRSEIKRRNARR